ncbi:MAG: efflux RND transporter periplasmic adaptor subunit [Bacteroidales bacterium]
MKKKKYIALLAGILLVAGLWYFLRDQSVESNMIRVPAVRGDFRVSVFTSGELEAKNSEDIKGPTGLRRVGVWNAQIAEMVPEGTVVEEGDWVATLDRADISNRIQDLETELEKLENSQTQVRLDTTMDMRNARDELKNLEFNYEEARINLELSQFEPQATIRQAEINMDKAKRAYEQAKDNYELRKQQAEARMREVNASLAQVERRYENMLEVLDEFVIHAPKDGMVIYRRDWDGTRITVGSQISSWNNTVAMLPDFSVMLSRTYVNEIDISKVQENQPVEVVVDAFPDRKYTGFVTNVANIGEQRPNQDARVFEVEIQINESDTIMRPAMTTKNTIITHVENDVLYIPIEGIHTLDTLNYVFKEKNNRPVRQEVITGMRNDNEIVIRRGLEEGEMIYLTVPPDAGELSLITL